MTQNVIFLFMLFIFLKINNSFNSNALCDIFMILFPFT